MAPTRPEVAIILGTIKWTTIHGVIHQAGTAALTPPGALETVLDIALGMAHTRQGPRGTGHTSRRAPIHRGETIMGILARGQEVLPGVEGHPGSTANSDPKGDPNPNQTLTATLTLSALTLH